MKTNEIDDKATNSGEDTKEENNGFDRRYSTNPIKRNEQERIDTTRIIITMGSTITNKQTFAYP